LAAVKVKYLDVKGAAVNDPQSRLINKDPALVVAGIDIGGTQCSVNLASFVDGQLSILERDQFATSAGRGPFRVLDEIVERLRRVMSARRLVPAAIGVSCGGPLDRVAGRVQSPPNLPGWDDVPVVDAISEAVGLPCYLENDANAGALAERSFGAARGYSDVLFITFGTGLGAGLVLDGRLYRGAGGLAGELGHWRVAPPDGPVHYGKAGSLESFCSGSGIVGWYRHLGGAQGPDGGLSAAMIADRARSGEPLARQVFDIAARQLGLALALVADLLDLDMAVIGGIYGYANDLLKDGVEAALASEALPAVRRRMKVSQAALGDRVGSFASCCVALQGLDARPATQAPGLPVHGLLQGRLGR
jgi:glucokinase